MEERDNEFLHFNIKKTDKANRTGSPTEVQASKDIIAWFQNRPYLKTNRPEPSR